MELCEASVKLRGYQYVKLGHVCYNKVMFANFIIFLNNDAFYVFIHARTLFVDFSCTF
jgi:hypothetical protein